MKTNFASIAEARAHYILKGYRTLERNDSVVEMIREDDMTISRIRIVRLGFMDIIVEGA
jgi:hypothetical protein